MKNFLKKYDDSLFYFLLVVYQCTKIDLRTTEHDEYKVFGFLLGFFTFSLMDKIPDRKKSE